MKKKPNTKAKLNYQQRVVATPHGLSANETDRAHQVSYFIIDTLAQYQENFLKREYNKFWFELSPKEAIKRIDKEMSKSGVNVFTSTINHSVIFNIHFAIYEYQGKKFLCPRMIIRDLEDPNNRFFDGGPILVAPHCLARMLSRSGMEFKEATKLLGGVLLQLMMAQGESKIPCFNQSLGLVSEIGVKGIGNLRCDRLLLEEDVLCDGSPIISANKSILLLKTWIDEKTLPDDYYKKQGGALYQFGERVQ